MAKVTLTNDDGSTVDFNDQAFTDAAVAAALAAVTTPPVSDDTVEVDLIKADGSTKKFVAA